MPAGAGNGIVFHRTDDVKAMPVAANPTNISATNLSTTIGNGINRVATIEHLMAAFAGLGIDNATVQIDGPEVPILDGSSAPFVDAIQAVGVRRLEKNRKMLIVKKAFEVRDGEHSIRIEPCDKLTFVCEIEYASQAIGNQSLEFDFSRSGFMELCNARTFCHIAEVEAMRKNGLALGGSLENAVVVDDKKVMNAEGLRGRDEFVRHKLLDCIGDLALLGSSLVGKVTTHKSGHSLHAKFTKELWSKREEYLAVIEIGTFKDERKPAVSERVVAIAAASAING
jgi:UDP-3-O-[3-hydroxymyristoyl] N-acetylglucosamine deacetylase